MPGPITLYRGDIYPVGLEGEEAVSPEMTAKGYDAEAAGGFYLTESGDLAVSYAVRWALGEGAVPYLHVYEVDVDAIRDELRSLCFDALESGALEYIGDNIAGRLPEWCLRRGELDAGEPPRRVCHLCHEDGCERSAAYVRVLVSDNVLFDFDAEIGDRAAGRAGYDEVVGAIAAKLERYGFALNVQHVLREPTGRHVDKVDDVPVPELEVERWAELLDSRS